MWLSTTLLAALTLSAVPAAAQLNQLAKQAGLLYFGTATDTPYERERAAYAQAYPQYDAIFADPAEFGQTTPTNGQKWLFTQPSPTVFNFTEGDVVADLAAATGKLLRCHALVWHSQLAPWVEATNWTAAALREAVERHVRTVVGYYRGRCRSWDVVNEALDEDGSYRASVFYRVLGDEYIRLAFRAAAEADPAARLYYNDYGIERPASNKTAGARRLVRMLREAGVRIDGVGLQAHLHADSHPTAAELIETARGFGELVREVAFTELDVRIELPVNETNLAWQKEAYQDVVTACVKVEQCVGITVWDFYDPFSWIPATFPGQGAPLLWFDNFTKHPAYDGMVQTFKQLIAERGGKPCRRRARA
ncbi:c43a5859-af78-48c3-99ed-df7672ee5c76 [Thermothielavioides terrestris]|jgi:endo-1,4-beta-xylanase|uniref:Beta-xylanase n=2 Tax=Thermothielavioides terrestris TaxID=2587410 RepID=G2QSH7_THETT|nr:glycoside hydrolase family 10 protein [Thermothielavioides terrestris NRRL 8126]AEO63459.1 glycoside hydrolase family 10 protein [Thermothielavioides terrestris NRRL 8126]SPQ21048.1 c43a5859-af78-48c3-99ed-df7672ee5c76 [Thermothielavioides terrestris]